jgi:hypothetical protein
MYQHQTQEQLQQQQQQQQQSPTCTWFLTNPSIAVFAMYSPRNS